MRLDICANNSAVCRSCRCDCNKATNPSMGKLRITEDSLQEFAGRIELHGAKNQLGKRKNGEVRGFISKATWLP